MGWSFKIGRLFGIDLYMHWTFPLLLAFIAGSALMQGAPLIVAAEGVLFVAAVFACVVLHEYGHALTARRFGLEMRGITLFIFGGVAEMTDEPPSAKAEFWVAIAGPTASVVIGVVCFRLGLAGQSLQLPPSINGVLFYLGWINGILPLPHQWQP